MSAPSWQADDDRAPQPHLRQWPDARHHRAHNCIVRIILPLEIEKEPWFVRQ